MGRCEQMDSAALDAFVGLVGVTGTGYWIDNLGRGFPRPTRNICAFIEHTLPSDAIWPMISPLEGQTMPRAAAENTNRFPMQIPPAEKARLMRAAALERTSLKDFVLRNALIAAEA